jgi:light-regulated signal transduction histidine kinase (bacteriophytochrome)
MLYARLAKAHQRERQERQRLVVQGRELLAANRELDAFSFSVSHDLRAPLRAIDGYARMLEEDYADRLDAEARRFLAVVRKSCTRMAQLIDDLLTMARVTRERMQLRSVPLEPIVREAIAEAAPGIAGRDVEFVVGDLGEANTDPALLRQVFLNLVGNAAKFTRDAAQARIEIGCERAAGAIPVYFVKDNGAGFDMRYADKLFSAFARLHSADEFPGTGIGLAIVARIVARHGGRVWAEAEPGLGATFRFTLAAKP